MSSVTETKAKGEGVDFAHEHAAKVVILDREQALIDVTPRRKKVAICGFASSSRDLAPFHDPEWEIWGLNQLYRHIPRADRWFEIHHNWNEHVVEGTDHAAWIRDSKIPIYMIETIPQYPATVRYPIERALKVAQIDYFTSTVAFMIALAIDEGFEMIGLWGIDLIVGTEYFHQKACCEFLLGIAAGRGIDIVIPPQSALLRQLYRYGYQSEPRSWPIARSEMQKRHEELINQKGELVAKIRTLDGALQDVEYWLALIELREKGGQIPT